MNFVTLEFAVFFGFVLTLNQLLQNKPGAYKPFLLACNLVFYATAGFSFVPLLLSVAVLNWGTARLLASRLSAFVEGEVEGEKRALLRRKLILGLDIAFHVALLAFFKYYEMVLNSLETLAGLGGWRLGLPAADILFPVGLSFYTFQGLSYAIDAYRNPSEPPRPFMDVLLFVSFFPTIMAGPILRAHQFLPQLAARQYTDEQLREGFALILSGLFKKVVLASYLSEHIVRDVFESPEFYSSWAVLAAVYGYSVQIFCDFSGYSDMALGVGRLLGYRLPENFRSPYLAVNLQDFWRRWHITLSLWLRDYLYIPLGGSRKGNRYLNLIVTMALGGLWHGSSARFLLWGVLHGCGLAVVHGYHELKGRYWPSGIRVADEKLNGLLHRAGPFLAWLLTFHFVSFLWVFFRAEDLDRCFEIFRRVLCFGQPGEGFAVLVIPAVLAGLLVQLLGKRLFTFFVAAQGRLPWLLQAVVLAVLGSMVLKMGPDGVMPFIYFQF